MEKFRIEKDTMGEVKVPSNKYWGAQTQRSIQNFSIAQDVNKMPIEIIHAFAILKKAAAITNAELGVLEVEKKDSQKPMLPEGLQLFVEESQPIIEKAVSQAIEKGKPYNLEIKARTAKGKELWVYTNGKPNYNSETHSS